jgi:photosystem II oxygen-evolving enhancer protein 2
MPVNLLLVPSKMYSPPFLALMLSMSSFPATVSGWSSQQRQHQPSITPSPLSRRQVLFQQATAAALVLVSTTPLVSHADEPRVINRMGGLLEAYQDSPRGLRIMAPSGWNRFEGEVGAYDVKWQDLVDPTENIKISSTPIKSTITTVAAIGPVQQLGDQLASKRNAKLLSAKERVTEGLLFYSFDFALGDATHQLLLLCVSKGKLWSVDASAKERKWDKRKEMYQNVLASFVPKLNP